MNFNLHCGLMIILLAMTGCNEPKKVKDSEKGKNTAALHVPGECGNTIYMDESLTSRISNWNQNNSRYITTTVGTSNDPRPDSRTATCSHNHVLISLTQFDTSNSFDEFADWLQTNGPNICYAQTNKLIECEHRVFDLNEIARISQNAPERTWKYSKLLNRIEGAGLENFETCTYENYISLTFRLFELDVDTLRRYNDDTNCFSIPLIKSIAARHNFTPNTEIEFRRLYLNGHRQIFLSPKGTDFFYNFSQVPDSENAHLPYSPL